MTAPYLCETWPAAWTLAARVGLGSARGTSLPAQPRVRPAPSSSRATPSTGKGLQLGAGVGMMGGGGGVGTLYCGFGVLLCVLWAFHIPGDGTHVWGSQLCWWCSSLSWEPSTFQGWYTLVGLTAVFAQSPGQEMPK